MSKFDWASWLRLAAEIIEGVQEAKPSVALLDREILVCINCHHVIRIDGEKCSKTQFISRQVLDPYTLRSYELPWKYICGECAAIGFEFSIDAVRPQTGAIN